MTDLVTVPQTTLVMVGDIALLQESVPRPVDRAQIYDPTWGDPSYALWSGKRIIPAPGSIAKDPDGTPHWVASIDPVTYYPTYVDFKVSDDSVSGVSFYTLDNARFALYVDTRTSPYTVLPDGKLVVEGVSPRSYRLVRNANTNQREVISRYRDITGAYTAQIVPLVRLSNTLNLWYLPTCYVYPTLDVNEEILVEIMDETGLVVRTATLFVANSEFVNDAMVYRPQIVGFDVTSNQTLANGDFYVYQNQAVKNLHLTAIVTYQDGHTEEIPVNKDNCFLYGDTDFVSSFPGLRQPFLVRYFLGEDMSASANLLDLGSQSVFKEISVVVVPNDMKTPVKIALDLIWNLGSNMYNTRWMMYFSDDTPPVDISTMITFAQGSLTCTPAYFGLSQSFRVSVDMSLVDPSNYTITTPYSQDFTVMLRPPTALVRWLIQDGADTTRVYGADSATSRRPRICYDNTLKQYFIPTGIFGTQDAFLESFYYATTPPYDPRTASGPAVPTHFRIRESMNFVVKISAPIAIADYGKSFNMIGDTAGNYVNGTVLVEFLTQTGDGTFDAIFAGAVDVSTGTWQGA